MNRELEHLLDSKVKPLVGSAVHKHLGIALDAIPADISDRLKKQPLLDYPLNTSVPFKKAKLAFKKYFLRKLLHLHAGNISEAARQAGIDRRSIHRLLAEFRLDADRFRKEQDYAREHAVQNVIHQALDAYKPALHPVKFRHLYESATALSKDIARAIPEQQMTLKDAEQEFEKAFLSQALAEHKGNISRTAKTVGLTFEHLHRKMKTLGISG